jgi:uncharacterized membrane protein (UPF0127 family)
MEMRNFIILLIMLLLGCTGTPSGNTIVIGGERFSVEVADTPEERSVGLMYRTELCESCGMLFIFEHEDKYGFWMKNTLIPLDMVFIDSEFTVVDILRAEPCMEDPCPGYKPMGKALYVLEVNKGTFDDGIVGEKAAISIN